MVQLLLRAKVLEKYRLIGAYHLIETDATGVRTVLITNRPHKAFKNEKRTWTAYVLETKISYRTGLAFQWPQNG